MRNNLPFSSKAYTDVCPTDTCFSLCLGGDGMWYQQSPAEQGQTHCRATKPATPCARGPHGRPLSLGQPGHTHVIGAHVSRRPIRAKPPTCHFAQGHRRLWVVLDGGIQWGDLSTGTPGCPVWHVVDSPSGGCHVRPQHKFPVLVWRAAMCASHPPSSARPCARRCLDVQPRTSQHGLHSQRAARATTAHQALWGPPWEGGLMGRMHTVPTTSNARGWR